jgi:hypothetical protein
MKHGLYGLLIAAAFAFCLWLGEALLPGKIAQPAPLETREAGE